MTIDELTRGFQDMQVRAAWDILDFGSAKSSLFVVVPATLEQVGFIQQFTKTTVVAGLPWFAVVQEQDDGECSVVVQEFKVLYQRFASILEAISEAASQAMNRIIAQVDERPDPAALRELVLGDTKAAAIKNLYLEFDMGSVTVHQHHVEAHDVHVYFVSTQDHESAWSLTELKYGLHRPWLASVPWLSHMPSCTVNTLYVITCDHGHYKLWEWSAWQERIKTVDTHSIEAAIKAVIQQIDVPGFPPPLW